MQTAFPTPTADTQKADSELQRLPIWRRIEEMVAAIPGWTPLDQLYSLFNLVYFSPIKGDVLEIGSWCGRSSAVLALACKLSGNGRLFCVDLFPEKSDWQQNPDGTYSFKVAVGKELRQGHHEQTVWKEPFERDIAPLYENHSGIFEVFESNIKKHRLQDVVTSFKGTSQDFFASSVSHNLYFKLAFIDADHSYTAVADDIRLAERHFLPGSWICFDDAFSSYEGVNEAIQKHIIDNTGYERKQQLTRKFFVARKT